MLNVLKALRSLPRRAAKSPALSRRLQPTIAVADSCHGVRVTDSRAATDAGPRYTQQGHSATAAHRYGLAPFAMRGCMSQVRTCWRLWGTTSTGCSRKPNTANAVPTEYRHTPLRRCQALPRRFRSDKCLSSPLDTCRFGMVPMAARRRSTRNAGCKLRGAFCRVLHACDADCMLRVSGCMLRAARRVACCGTDSAQWLVVAEVRRRGRRASRLLRRWSAQGRARRWGVPAGVPVKEARGYWRVLERTAVARADGMGCIGCHNARRKAWAVEAQALGYLQY